MLENLEDLFVEDQRDHVEWWVDEVQREHHLNYMVMINEVEINHHLVVDELVES
jgi:hypothetical protein